MARRVPPTPKPAPAAPADDTLMEDLLDLIASLPYNHQVSLPDGRQLVAGHLVNRLLARMSPTE